MIICDYCSTEFEEAEVTKVKIEFTFNHEVSGKTFHFCEDCIDLAIEFKQNIFENLDMYL